MADSQCGLVFIDTPSSFYSVYEVSGCLNDLTGRFLKTVKTGMHSIETRVKADRSRHVVSLQ